MFIKGLAILYKKTVKCAAFIIYNNSRHTVILCPRGELINIPFYGLIELLGSLFLFFLIIGIALYVLKSIGLYKLAVNDGIDNAWLAWLPVGDAYIIAKLIKSLKIGNWDVPNIEIVLPVGYALVIVASGIPLIGALIVIAYTILFLFALYRLYYIYRPDQAVLWLVLSIVLAFMSPIFIFMMRNDRPAQQAN